MGRLLRALALGLALGGLTAWDPAAWAETAEPVVAAEPGAGPVVVAAQVDGVIDSISAQYLGRVLREAESTQAELLLIELNTPGGLLSSMEAMTQLMLASRVPIVVYVTPTGARAGSAGVFIAMAADVVAMAPGTVIGAAHPVSIGGAESDPVTTEKVTNYTAAYARTLATTKGHNADWAEQAVRSSVALTEREAVGQGVADLVARDADELLGQVAGHRVTTASGERVLPTLTGARIERYPPNPAEIALKLIADPNVALLLLLVGFVGIVVEIYHPGAFVPGLAGGICLVLAFVALGSLPTNWGGVALLSFSLVLFILELHLPSHGVLGVGGVIAFLAGGLLVFAPLTPVAPVFTTVEVNRWLLGAASVAFAGFFLLALRAGLGARQLPVTSRLLGLAGTTGITASPLLPTGTVLIGHEHWSAVAEGGAIGPGEAVEVVAREGLRLRVRRAAPAMAGESETGEVGLGRSSGKDRRWTWDR